jgi:hypothetical protein
MELLSHYAPKSAAGITATPSKRQEAKAAKHRLKVNNYNALK